MLNRVANFQWLAPFTSSCSVQKLEMYHPFDQRESISWEIWRMISVVDASIVDIGLRGSDSLRLSGGQGFDQIMIS